MKRSRLLLASVLVSLAACGSHAKLPDGVPLSAVQSACKQQQADGTSEVFLMRDAGGKPARLELTPSRTIADAGNMIFDMEGHYLGAEAGSEFPRENKELLAKEQARVAALLGGAVRSNTPPIARCKDVL
jgi:predicted small lipoprotein YifL